VADAAATTAALGRHEGGHHVLGHRFEQAVDDAAEAAAVILASDGGYDGPTTLTASAAPTFDEIARIASDLTGRTIRSVVVDQDEWIAGQAAAGQPEPATRFTLGMYQAAQQGFFSGVDPLLGTLLGREPHTVREVLGQPLAG
jgi:NAD(P)H dehydrogenase (quinone)